MTRYKINLEYDGTGLIGWQENHQGPSVQSIVQDAIFRFCGEHTIVYSAGRTDAGVHAICMTAHFDLETDKKPNTVMRALNFYLNKEPVSVLSCEQVDEDFHSRYSCIARHYKYVVINRASPVVLQRKRVWWVTKKLDIEKMRAAAEKLIGKHDFTSFRAAHCQANSPIKTLDSVTITKNGDEVVFEFSARSFLHHQVRNMVGTLVEIGLGKPYDIDEIFAQQKRDAAGITAPACGLYFVAATYATDDDLKNS